MALKLIIAPSILAADFGKLQAELDSIASADWVQIDVMDGHFVPNLSFGAPVLKCLKTKLLIDVHLMVSNPADRVDEFVKAGANNITFHAEAVKTTEDRRALIQAIHATGCTAGIALNPATPVSELDDVINDVDMVLIMSVNPGFGGQKFIAEVLAKAKMLRAKYPNLMLQIDGGIDAATAKLARDAGINNIVAGSSVFREAGRSKAIAALRA
ncbi:MAG TPA: ribulose-phosphate 3-epimerase [Candidatus Peribacteria bacterium]|nr:ribulose-phosphate 3-epimerase [Candidatus Peribacteria bacterium]